MQSTPLLCHLNVIHPEDWGGIYSKNIRINIILLILLTAIEFSLGGSSPNTSIQKTNKNKYT